MRLVTNTQVEERQPTLQAQQTTVFLAQLLKAPIITRVPNTPLKAETKGYIRHFVSRDSVLLPEITGEPGKYEAVGTEDTLEVSLFMQALHAAFAEHVPFSLAPQIAWYMIAHEIAVHIRLNANNYRGYFTASAERDTIFFRDDSLIYGSPYNFWSRAINKVREPMAEKVPQATIQLLLPHFSTSSVESETALLVLFLDIVANYYDLRLFSLCGIPAVRLEGDTSDWQTIVNHAEMAQREFTGLKDYFTDLLPVLREIAGTVGGQEPDPEFWSSIYKYKDASGGPFINGWITAFFAHKMTSQGFMLRDDLDWRKQAQQEFSGFTSTDLPVHLSKVPFVWDYLGRTINMAFMAGVMGVAHDGFVNPKLGYAVLEEMG